MPSTESLHKEHHSSVTFAEETRWDWLPPEIQEYILDLRAGQLHRERLKEVTHTF